MKNADANMDSRGVKEIWVLDDETVVLQYLSTVVTSVGGHAKCFQAADELLNQGEQAQPCLILVDWLLPKPDGLRIAVKCRQRWFTTPVILMSGQATVALAVDAMRQGLAGVVEKGLDRDELIQEIKAVIEPPKPFFLGDESTSRAKSRIAMLNGRQLAILKLLSAGVPNKVIALRLDLSLRTIEKERSGLFTKLGVTSAAEAAGMLALALGPGCVTGVNDPFRLDEPETIPGPMGIRRWEAPQGAAHHLDQ